MQNPYNSMSNGDLHIIYKDYVHSKETGNRCESFVPYAKEIKENNYIDYQKVIDLVTQNQIAPKYRKQFIKNTSLKNLEDNMKYLGYYSFKVFDLENKVVHYSYYWFDQKKKLCFVLLMI